MGVAVRLSWDGTTADAKHAGVYLGGERVGKPMQ